MITDFNNLSRRSFIDVSAKGSVAASLSIGAFGSFLASCSATNKMQQGNAMPTGFTQTPLPYAYNALEPRIDARTMEIHYTKHAAGYAAKLQAAVKAEGVKSSASVEDILHNISMYSTTMRNNAGGHYNHELFWKCMKPMATFSEFNGTLKEAIDKTFGSYDNFKTEFNAAAGSRFGSGWAWLYMDGNKNLKIGSTPNQDNPLMPVSAIQGFPLLGLDVWEHAYYLKYQNKRADYVSSWWALVNWEYVQERFNKA